MVHFGNASSQSSHFEERNTRMRNRMLQARRLLLATLSAAALLAAAPRTIELDSATIRDLNAAFDSGALTSEKLVEMCLARIQAYDHRGPGLNAVMALN